MILSILEKKLPEISFVIKDKVTILVSGEDSTSFLNGQITVNVEALLPGSFEFFCRLDPKGQIKYTGYVLRSDKEIFLLVDKAKAEILLTDLDLFIISEDVILKEVKNYKSIEFSNDAIRSSSDSYYCGVYNFIPGYIKMSLEAKSVNSSENLIPDALSTNLNGLFNELLQSEFSSHKSKGCFVGQEVVKKIENNRGARLFPLILSCDQVPDEELDLDSKLTTRDGEHFGNLIKVFNQNDRAFILISAKRQYHLEGKNIEVFHKGLSLNGEIILIHDHLKSYYHKISEDLFYESVDLLNDGKEVEARYSLTLSILLNPANIDSIEALGVYYGRQKNFILGHALMDRLLSIDKSSIMAHTNKSLFYMNEGKIEEAELEKDLALKKSISNEAPNNRNENNDQVERVNKLNKQLEMYKEVLEIDPDDEFAQSKFVEILYETQEYGRVVKYLSSLEVENKPKLFVWLIKSIKKKNGDIGEVSGKVEAVLQKALKIGDKKSADYLKNLCK